MNIDMLRQWVRGELDPVARRAVGRWMLRSPDPELPEVVYGLVRELEQEKADLALLSRSPDRSFVVALWRQLLDMGQATIEALRPPALAGGPVLGSAGTGTSLGFRKVDPEIVIDLVLHEAGRIAAVIGTTDLGDEHLLVEPTILESGTYPQIASWCPEQAEGRVTLWLVHAPAHADPSGLRDLASAVRLVRSGVATIVAARWSDPV